LTTPKLPMGYLLPIIECDTTTLVPNTLPLAIPGCQELEKCQLPTVCAITGGPRADVTATYQRQMIGSAISLVNEIMRHMTYLSPTHSGPRLCLDFVGYRHSGYIVRHCELVAVVAEILVASVGNWRLAWLRMLLVISGSARTSQRR